MSESTPRIYGLLDLLFAHEVIDGHGRRPYMHRWVLLRWPSGAIYLHHFIGSDWSLDLHDHPKDFTSIGLKGRYAEIFELPETGGQWSSKLYRAPWFRRFPAEHRHRLVLERGESAWTLVHVGEKRRDWGFYYVDEFIPWEDYVYSELADLRTDRGQEGGSCG